jgi:DNA-binding response OmpR family regulator
LKRTASWSLLWHATGTPVVVLTRCLEMSCYLEAMQLGAVDYLEKPLPPAEFERLVTAHCQPQPGEISACIV